MQKRTSTATQPVLDKLKTNPPLHDSIKNDLSTERPIWPLATYGPAKHEPNLITGLDESLEELRVRAVAALKAGNVNEYTAYEAAKIAAAEQTLNNARTNISQVFQTAAAQSPHAPKPTSAFTAATTTTPASTSTATSTSSTFGVPSAFAKPAFGQSAFVSPASTSTTATFGQPAQAPPSAFGGGGGGGGTTTAPPPTTTTAFGQSSFAQQQPTSAFGQPSSLVKPASGAFSAFANTGPSPFAAAAAAAAANPTTTTAAVSGGGFSAFATQPGTSPFGSGGNVFGQSGNTTTSAFGNNSGGGSAFGSNNSTPFGTTTTTSAFGTPSAFGTQPPQSVFNTQPTSTSTSAFGNSPTNTFNPLGSAQPPPPSSIFTPLSNSSHPPTSTSASAPGPPDFSATKKYFEPGSTPYDQMLPPGYVKMIPQGALEAFKGDRFEWGNVPDWIPPVELR